MFNYAKRDKGEVCQVRGCRNKRGKKTGKLCDKHHAQVFAKNHPRAYRFNNLRKSALRRGIDFDITFDYYCGLLDASGFALNEMEDERKDWLTIDRVDATLGYSQGNLQILSLGDNSAKSHREAFLPEDIRKHIEGKREQILEYSGGDSENDDPEEEEEIDPDQVPF